ncbi:quinone-dependent dihydroorotate dehydrogenase [Candidatus Saccharibacteria bacterium]|jgi:dihydroorotate dehydrogenase|nr:quinone-dependent dihydroorotate dehydrogenase [Candidatus Saccharibacteria bacterium]
MNKIISKSSELMYRRVIKPILFRRLPDEVHDNLLKLASRYQKYSFICSLLNKSWAYRNDKYLSQEVLGIKFHNPVGLSAGFDKNIELAPMLKAIGFGFMEGGSLTLDECEGNPRPWFYRLPKTKSLVVFAGLANQGVKIIVARIKKYPAGTFNKFPLNISVAKTNTKENADDEQAINDYIGSLKYIKGNNVGEMITINISCPNTFGGEPFTTPTRLDKLLVQVDATDMPQPIFIKMPADLSWEDFDKLLQVILKHKVDGVTISNLAKDRNKAELKDPLPDSINGNLSGLPTQDLSNELIRRTYNKYGKQLIIIGVGGIFSEVDAYTKIKLGATLVELITGMIFNGPQLVGQINSGLVTLLKKDGFETISQAIGVDA